jgi:serine/threonine protein kinase/tetratricopeptide (TPR) repeat protein
MLNQSLSEQSIFLEALERPAGKERAAYLDEVCGSNRRLRTDVEALLKANERLPGLNAGDKAPALPPTIGAEPIGEGPGTIIGPYKLLEQIGEGAFGLVFMAEQRQPLRRKVALKVLKPGMDTRQVVARFEAERQALALMDHPNIAGVYDGGETSSGRPYFVMELVKGLPITEHCDQNNLTLRERLGLFIDVCQAVQHAHQKGIIHRDLKPSNVLVMRHDGTPVVKVIDFGIAKATGQQLTDKTLFTNFAQLIGTPLYMSPEQAGQSDLDVDTRSDIYSLGVLLYELLTGYTPFDRKRIREAAFDELRRIIREEEPPKPSTRISTMGDAGTKVAAQRKSDPKRLSQLFRGELDWIVMKSLEKDRTRRYDTASALAADVHRYLADEPVEACPPSGWYRFRKFARRNKVQLAAAACLLCVLTVIAGGVGWVLQERAGREKRTAYEVELILQDVPGLVKDKKWSEAMAAVNRAEGLYAGGHGSNELLQRLRQARAAVERGQRQARVDQRMSNDLMDLRLSNVQGVNTGPGTDKYAAADAYAAAFRQYGIDVDNLKVADAAAKIRSREIASDLVVAMDYWTDVRRNRQPNESGWKHLLAVAKSADSDPFRNQVRDALASRDKEALLKLATASDTLALPPTTLHLLGQALGKTGANDQAIILLQRAQLQHPGDFWINYELHNALRRLTPVPYEKAIAYCMAALAIHKSPGVYNNLGFLLFSAGREEEGRAAYQQAARLDPNLDWTYHNQGRALINRRRYDEAITNFRIAISIKPDQAATHDNLGVALRGKRLLDEAIAEQREAVRLDPSRITSYTNLAYSLHVGGFVDEAINVLREAIRLKPADASLHSRLARELEEKGLLDEAIAEWREGHRLATTNNANGFFNPIGRVLVRKGSLDEAIAVYQEGISRSPANSNLYQGLANALRKQGKLDEAQQADQQAFALIQKQLEKPVKAGDINGHLGRAWALANHPDPKLRNPKQAVEMGKVAVQLGPQFSDSWNNLGVAYYRNGELNAAIEALDRAAEMRLDRPAYGHDEFFWLAMAHWKLGDKAQAYACFDTGDQLFWEYSVDDGSIARIRGEAAEMLGIEKVQLQGP